MTQLSPQVRSFVSQRAKERCEYCLTLEESGAEMHVDHIKPLSAAGSDEIDNLAYACSFCNTHKSSFQAANDPITSELIDLFNPRLQLWTEHFQWSEDGAEVVGLTPTGRATVERLQMNREMRVRARKLWVRGGWHPPID